jgi:hypothetical protein
MRAAVLLLSALTLGSVSVEVQQPSPPRAAVELRLAAYVASLRTIAVRVVDETPMPFLLDTGGGFTVLTPEVARAAGCIPFGRVTGFRSSGERLDFPRCGPVTLTLGSLVVRTEAAIFDLAPLLKGAPPVGGIISLHTLQGRAVTLDLKANRLIIETSTSLAHRIRGASEIPVRASRQAGGAALDLFLEARTAQGSIWLELDSGNAGPVLISPHAMAQLGLSLSPEQPGRVALEVPGLGATSVDAVVKDLIYDGLLNAAFLESIVLTVDLVAERAWATRHRALASVPGLPDIIINMRGRGYPCC